MVFCGDKLEISIDEKGRYEEKIPPRYMDQEEGTIDKKWLKNKISDSVSSLAMNENITRGVIMIIIWQEEKIKWEDSTIRITVHFEKLLCGE